MTKPLTKEQCRELVKKYGPSVVMRYEALQAGHRKKLPAGCGGEKSNAQIRRERMAAFIAENPGVKGVELQAKFPDMNSFDITAMRRDKVIECVRDRNYSRYYVIGYVEGKRP